MSRTPEEAFSVALFHFDVVAEYVALGDVSQRTPDAIAMRLSAGIDAMSTLDDVDLLAKFADWPEMRGMRHRIAHGYIVTDSALILEAATHELPAVVDAIRRELE